MDIFGEALLDYQNGNYTTDIKTFSSLDEEDRIPLPYLFRTFKAMPALEQKALKLCKGNVLDIGCGAGSHSLYLQKKGLTITALDNSPGAITVCKSRGIQNAVLSDILSYDQDTFDTLLLLMNGIGLAGQLKSLDPFLSHLKTLLKKDGQILLDSSDIIYMYEMDEDGGYWVPNNGVYYGDVSFTMQYKHKKSEKFTWLYVDYNTLEQAAVRNNLKCELVLQGRHYDYLAKLSVSLQ